MQPEICHNIIHVHDIFKALFGAALATRKLHVWCSIIASKGLLPPSFYLHHGTQSQRRYDRCSEYLIIHPRPVLLLSLIRS